MIKVRIITRSEELPPMTCSNFFHSPELFRICEMTSGLTPFMAVAEENGTIVAHMLGTLRRRGSLVPPYLFTQGRIYGEGEYAPGMNKEEVFFMMFSRITKSMRRKRCLYIELSDLSQKMLGYKHLRQLSFFPVHWMEVHNSLHSMPPEKRLDEKMKARIAHAKEQGVEFKEVADYDEFRAFYRMLHRFLTLKVRRYRPPERMFWEMGQSPNCRLFVTRWHNKVIGGCACICSGPNIYLWYLASKRKSHPTLQPATATVWGAISHAYEHKFRHIFFMDVGLPFKKSKYRDFILSYGGKEVSAYRWFYFTFPPLNRILTWIYKE